MKSVYYINFYPYNQCNKKAAVIENQLKRERRLSVASKYLLKNYYDFYIEINYFKFSGRKTFTKGVFKINKD